MDVGDLLCERYQISDRIGQGGMQEVYSAYDRIVDRPIVVKTPLEGQTHRRFKQSAILAARINNHGIARTLDYFEVQKRPYLVEEFIDGDTLDRAILGFSGYVDPHLGAQLLGILAKGISASHHVGVVHRDLKPSNIMIAGGFSLQAAKITDFGIATLTQEVLDHEIEANEDITKSMSGTVKGAIPYMAPEMMFRKAGQAIERPADIWSLGAIMFRALTGKNPFGVGLDAVVSISNDEREAWPNFMTSDPQFRPLSEALQKIVESCLQTKPLDRPSADDIVGEISRLCLFISERHFGTIINMPNRYYGFIDFMNGDRAMFHRESVYGPNQPAPSKGVIFARSEGYPRPRAFPVLVAA